MLAKKCHQSLRSVKDSRQRKKPGGGEGWAAKLLKELKETPDKRGKGKGAK